MLRLVRVGEAGTGERRPSAASRRLSLGQAAHSKPAVERTAERELVSDAIGAAELLGSFTSCGFDFGIRHF